MNPHKVTQDFEQALCDYTGAKYAVATTSCTMALLLSCKYVKTHTPIGDYSSHIQIPKFTYVSVPQVIKQAKFGVIFVDDEWSGEYQLKPYPIIDSARWFSSGIYQEGEYRCVSFHWSKTLSIGQGGAILHDNDEADKWFRKARFDGRTEGVAPADDDFDMIGYHAYMSPRDAADGLSRLAVLPKHNDPLPNDNYPDLSKFEVFK